MWVAVNAIESATGHGLSPGLARAVRGALVDDTSAPVTVERVRALIRQADPLLGPDPVERGVAEVMAEITGLGPLQPLLADPAISDVLVNGPGPVWVERSGVLEQLSMVLDRAEIEALVERIVAPLGLQADRSRPLVDARLPDGSRVHIVLPPLAVDGPCLTIRRFTARSLPLTDFCPADVAGMLARAVRERADILVSGGTGAGKTTLLNALAAHIPPGERVVTIEDAAELRLGRDNVVRLEARPANADGVGQVGVRELLRNALRMRPDRIVVGEVRGPEALDMLQAMLSGHEGSLGTVHANGPDEALRRIETLILMGDVAIPAAVIREQIRSALDLVVHVARVGRRRRIVAVAKVEIASATVSDGHLATSVGTRLIADGAGLVDR